VGRKRNKKKALAKGGSWYYWRWDKTERIQEIVKEGEKWKKKEKFRIQTENLKEGITKLTILKGGTVTASLWWS